MNLTAKKILAVVVAGVVLATFGTYFVLRHRAISPRRAVTNSGRAAYSTQEFPLPASQALADLEGRVAGRQTLKDTIDEITIDLTPYVNCKLTDPLADLANQKDHTLASLAKGVHLYGGVPFDVEGIVQLTGGSVRTGLKLWPMEVPAIAVGHAFKKLHLLHGAFNIVAPQGHYTFARLVLHYADGSQQEMKLDGGTHTLRSVDAWIPQELAILPSPQTELAWMGTNPYLKENNPSAALHLYRTTLVNPRPDIAVTNIDYVSAMGNPGPFMVGMTVE